MEALFPSLRKYLQEQEQKPLEATELHRHSLAQLKGWLQEQLPRQACSVLVVCTGNSRRSLLGAILGNLLAAYRGWKQLRFYSAGTAPTAFHPNTIATLEQIGVRISATSKLAPPGKDGLKNPQYRVQWGSLPTSEQLEFSKALGDPSLPGKGFAALLICSEADQECPSVAGAALRLPLPLEDPKTADQTPRVQEAYAHTRDTIARMLLTLR